MDTLNYLAYGSNLLPARLAARIAVRGVAGVVALPDRALAFDKRGADGSGKAHLVAAPGETAWGVVYRIAADDKPTLDRIEGVGHGYDVEIVVAPGIGPCFLYSARAAARAAGLLPFDWYLAYVLEGARHHLLPDDYRARLATVRTRRDPDDARRAENYARLGIAPQR